MTKPKRCKRCEANKAVNKAMDKADKACDNAWKKANKALVKARKLEHTCGEKVV